MLQKDIDNWFMTEVLPLESKLMGFLYRHFDTDITDLRQEIYIRIYEAAYKSLPDNTSAFVFATARNLIFDHLRRKKVISFDTIGDFESLQIDFEEPSLEDKLSSDKELKALKVVLKELPSRCRKVVELRKIQGYSQFEVAKKLGITESTVEKHIAKGIRFLADALYSRGRPFADNIANRGIVKKLKGQ